MLSTLDLMKLKVRASDGDIGSVRDLRFDDRDWTVRDLELEAAGGLFGRRVVINPDAVTDAETPGLLELDLTRDEVKALSDPAISSEPGRQTSEEPLTWPEGQTVIEIPETLLGGAGVPAQSVPAISEDARLHSVREIDGYKVMCGDEAAGKLVGFLIDVVAWDLPLAIVRLARRDILVLLPSRLINAIAWPERSLLTSLDVAMLTNAPAYDERIQDERVYLPVVTDYYASRSPVA